MQGSHAELFFAFPRSCQSTTSCIDISTFCISIPHRDDMHNGHKALQLEDGQFALPFR